LFVLPSLVLCYLGQGALVLRDPQAGENPFFAMVPAGPATLALVFLSSAATVIASQALISGDRHGDLPESLTSMYNGLTVTGPTLILDLSF
jgi:K+ transporter